MFFYTNTYILSFNALVLDLNWSSFIGKEKSLSEHLYFRVFMLICWSRCWSVCVRADPRGEPVPLQGALRRLRVRPAAWAPGAGGKCRHLLGWQLWEDHGARASLRRQRPRWYNPRLPQSEGKHTHLTLRTLIEYVLLLFLLQLTNSSGFFFIARHKQLTEKENSYEKDKNTVYSHTNWSLKQSSALSLMLSSVC